MLFALSHCLIFAPFPYSPSFRRFFRPVQPYCSSLLPTLIKRVAVSLISLILANNFAFKLVYELYFFPLKAFSQHAWGRTTMTGRPHLCRPARTQLKYFSFTVIAHSWFIAIIQQMEARILLWHGEMSVWIVQHDIRFLAENFDNYKCRHLALTNLLRSVRISLVLCSCSLPSPKIETHIALHSTEIHKHTFKAHTHTLAQTSDTHTLPS